MDDSQPHSSYESARAHQLDTEGPRRAFLAVGLDPANEQTLAGWCQKQGLDFAHASDAREALSLMDNQPISTVLANHLVGDRSGLDFLDAVRDKWPRTVRAILALPTEVAAVLEQVRRGVVHRLLVSPSNPDDLVRVAHLCMRQGVCSSESDHMKMDLLANLTREVRGPVSLILNIAQMMSDFPLSPLQKHFLDLMGSSSLGLLTVVDGYVRFSEIESGKWPVKNSEFDLRDLVEEAVDLWAVQAQAKGLELASDVPADIPTRLRGDPGRVRQILMNMIENAVRVTPRGEVVVRASKKHENESHLVLRLNVSDTGPGVDRERQAQLFRPFQSGAHPGAGMGLALSKRLVDILEGDIGVRSEEGKGAQFWFELPLEKSWRPSLPEKVFPASRALVVEHNESVRNIVTETLRTRGMTSESATCGREALDQLQRQGNHGGFIDVVLMDHDLPDMDGYTLAERIDRQAERLRQKNLFLLAPLTCPVDTERLLRSGVRALIPKPIHRAQLLDHLATLPLAG